MIKNILDTTKKAVIRYCKNLPKFSETPPHHEFLSTPLQTSIMFK